MSYGFGGKGYDNFGGYGKGGGFGKANEWTETPFVCGTETGDRERTAKMVKITLSDPAPKCAGDGKLQVLAGPVELITRVKMVMDAIGEEMYTGSPEYMADLIKKLQANRTGGPYDRIAMWKLSGYDAIPPEPSLGCQIQQLRDATLGIGIQPSQDKEKQLELEKETARKAKAEKENEAPRPNFQEMMEMMRKQIVADIAPRAREPLEVDTGLEDDEDELESETENSARKRRPAQRKTPRNAKKANR